MGVKEGNEKDGRLGEERERREEMRGKGRTGGKEGRGRKTREKAGEWVDEESEGKKEGKGRGME